MIKSAYIASDPVADMLARIRNAIMVGKSEVSMPHSNLKQSVANVLVAYGFLQSAKVADEDGRKYLTIAINSQDQPSSINEIDRVSRPGRRVYVKSDEIPTIKRGRGIVVLSTSKGVMSGQEAQAQRLGGELICKVY